MGIFNTRKGSYNLQNVEEEFKQLTRKFLEQGALVTDLKCISLKKSRNAKRNYILASIYSKKVLLLLFAPVFYSILLKDSQYNIMKNIYGTRCLLPNNYLVWEFTRPVSNCDYCHNISAALILPNLTREEFKPYEYSSRPIVIKDAAAHWPALKVFNWNFFKELYETIDGAYESVEECQFLHFKSNFDSLRDVFEMSDARAMHEDGEEPWYVGWKNCHLQVLDIMKEYYTLPHFLPEDSETPYANYIFFGYDEGAVMHLDYISRLMWQGQILGSKSWSVAPTPECDNVCKRFNFTVDTGDIVLLDTRIWYHGTHVRNGKFSLTVTSEYG